MHIENTLKKLILKKIRFGMLNKKVNKKGVESYTRKIED